MNRKCFPFQRKTAANERMKRPIAPIVLKTLGIPTAAVHAGMPNTKIVEKVFRKKVTAVRASPTISVSGVSRDSDVGENRPTFVGI